MAFKINVKVTDLDLGLNAIIRNFEELDNQEISAGVHEEAGEHPNANGKHTAEIAMFNEYGTSHIPERSFIRSTIDENNSLLFGAMEKIINNAHNPISSQISDLNSFGFLAKTLIENKIKSLQSPANAQSTIDKKGFNNPLIDTRYLLENITFKILKEVA